MDDIAKIAVGLSGGAKGALIDGCGCDNHTELVAAGLWTPSQPQGHPYYTTTPLGLAVRDYLRSKNDG